MQRMREAVDTACGFEKVEHKSRKEPFASFGAEDDGSYPPLTLWSVLLYTSRSGKASMIFLMLEFGLAAVPIVDGEPVTLSLWRGA